MVRKKNASSLTVCRKRTVAEMVVTVSHEINNPLQVLLGESEELLKKDLPEDAKKSLRMIYLMSERIREVIKRMQNMKSPRRAHYTPDIDMIALGSEKKRKKTKSTRRVV